MKKAAAVNGRATAPKVQTVLRAHRPKPEDLKTVDELMGEDRNDLNVPVKVEIPLMDYWQFQTLRQRIEKHYEENSPAVQLAGVFKNFPVGIGSDLVPLRLNVRLGLAEWGELVDIAHSQDWTLEEAVDELLYLGLQRWPHEQYRKEQQGKEKAKAA